MTVETPTALNPETITALQELIAINLDSEKGFREATAHCDDNPMVIGIFEDFARQRAANAAELQTYVNANGEDATESGTAAGTAHRCLLDMRGRLGGGVPVMLIEAERGEAFIKSKYEALLKENAGCAVTNVLNRQYAGVKAAHDEVLKLRDECNK